MKIRVKIVLIVLPLIITPLFLIGIAASLSARNGITRVATEFLRFKAEELKKYADTQWTLLVENDLTGNQEFIDVSKLAVESFARSLIRCETELIFAVDETGGIAMQTGDVEISENEADRLTQLMSAKTEGWQQIRLGGVERVAQASVFEPFGWYFMISEQRDAFYQAINQIFWQSGLIISITLFITILLLLVFSYYLTKPLQNIVMAMREIIVNNDLSKRVDLLYRDEIGELGHTFNLMTGELENAYDQIKGYALKAVVAQKKEQKIRNIFQKYVPKEVIDQFFQKPESMLVGESRILAVLFSDIRRFTSMSENMRPDEIVESLNAYFSLMVDVIMSRQGIVDKYIGDAIMAFYGAPVQHEDDAFKAVQSGFEMMEALKGFNQRQAERGRPEFHIGIGINYGSVTVGNIGSDKKMDYTVIGDMVNIASRLEGLTKIYHEEMIVSESVFRYVKKDISCRMLDRVAVKGKKQGIGIYSPRKELSQSEENAWKLHHTGSQFYYKREFEKATRYFLEVQKILPGDGISRVFLKRCETYMKSPPPADWNGVVVMKEK